MSHEVAQSNSVQPKKSPRSWFQFSLRTFLILTIVVAGILSQAASEIATARKKSQAIARLEAGGYRLSYRIDYERCRRWVTSLIPRSQWDEWFPRGDPEELERVKEIRYSVSRIDRLSPQETFHLLNAFETCRSVELDMSRPDRKSFSAADISSSHGWRKIVSLAFVGGLPDESALKELATSKKLKGVAVRSAEVSRQSLADFVGRSEIENLELHHVSFVGESPSPVVDSLTDREAQPREGELNSRESKSQKWNSSSLRHISLFGADLRELERLGELPALESLLFELDQPGPHIDAVGRLDRYPSLTHLTIIGDVNTSMLQKIRNLPSLRRLELFVPNGSEVWVDMIPYLRKMEVVHYSVALTQEDIAILRDIPGLEELSLGTQTLERMAILLDSKSLRHLTFLVETETFSVEKESEVDAFIDVAKKRGIEATIFISEFHQPIRPYPQVKAKLHTQGSP